MTTLQLDGESLTIGDVRRVAAEGARGEIAACAIGKMAASRALVERLAAGDEPIYAVNTGVGLLADVRIPRDELDLLQRNVIRSHAAGVGDPLAREVVRSWARVRYYPQAGHALAAGDRGKQLRDANRESGYARRQVPPFWRPIEPPVKIGRAGQRHGQAQRWRPPPAGAGATAPGQEEGGPGRNKRPCQQGPNREINEVAGCQPGHKRQQQPQQGRALAVAAGTHDLARIFRSLSRCGDHSLTATVLEAGITADAG